MQRISLVQRARNSVHLSWLCCMYTAALHHTAVPECNSCMLWTLLHLLDYHSSQSYETKALHCNVEAPFTMHWFALLTDTDSRREKEIGVQLTCRHHWLCGSTPAGCTRSQTPQLGCSGAGGGRQQQSAEAGGALPICCHSISPRPHSCKTPL